MAKAKPPDKVKALILERMDTLGLTQVDLAAMLGCGHCTISKRMRTNTREWLTEALVLCKTLGVPIEDFREAVSY